MRQQYGEKLKPESHLIRKQFDIRDLFAISKCRQIKSRTVTKKLIDLERSLIRQKEILVEGTIRSALK